MEDANVTVVTVTYGDRQSLLIRVIDAVQKQKVKKVVVVDNGSMWPVKKTLDILYGDFVDVVEMGRNTGSAKGFATGMRRALDEATDFLWLLDDDNCPRSDTLDKLQNAYEKSTGAISRDRLAMLCFRKEQHSGLENCGLKRRVNPRKNSFFGFHALDIPEKLASRVVPSIFKHRITRQGYVKLDMSPYGGLYFCRDLLMLVGFPDEKFFLYADDLEFTLRVTKKAGAIFLVDESILDDLQPSFIMNKYRNSFESLLLSEGDSRAYYTMRNLAYLHRFFLSENILIFNFNKMTYMIILFCFSIMLRKKLRYKLLASATQDGVRGLLGVRDEYPV